MKAKPPRGTLPPAPGPSSRFARFEAWLAAHPGGVAALLFAFALVVRGLYLAAFRDTPVARVPFMDEAFYRAEAWNLMRGAPMSSDAYFMTPLYPWFLSLVFRLVGDGPAAPYAVQLGLGALAAPLTWWVGRHALRPALALAAAAALACFAPLVFFEALFLVEGLVLLALLGALACAVAGSRRTAFAFIGGVCIGVAVLGRGSNLLILPVLAAWPWFDPHGTRRLATRRMLATVLGCLFLLAPLAARNTLRSRVPVFLTANFGFNLWVGNGAQATGIFVRVPGVDLQQDPLTVRYVQRQLHRPVTVSQASHFWLSRTRAWVRAHPGRTLRLFAWKLLLFWNRLSIPQVEGFEAVARDSPLSRAPFWSSFAFLPLGLLASLTAFWHAARQRRALSAEGRVRALLALWAWLYAASIAVFFITDRYRVPLLPVLVILGAATLQTVAAGLAPHRRRALLATLAGIGLCFLITSPQVLGVDVRRMRRDLHVHAALREAEAGRFDAALRQFAAAIALDPRDPETRDGRARILSRAGHDSLAIAAFRSLLRDHPDDARVWYNLGNAYHRADLDSAAMSAYQRSLALEPEREAAWNQLGEAYRARGDTARAADCYRSALAIVPAYEQALNNLAALRAYQGHASTAETGFRAAIAANPRYVPALVNLGILLTDSGRTAEAIRTWKQILAVDPKQETARRVLQELESGGTSHNEGDMP